MDAPKTRLVKVLMDVSAKLDRLSPTDRGEVRAAFDAAVDGTTDAQGITNGNALLQKLNTTVLAALPDEGPSREAFGAAVDRLNEERSYRGEEWCRVSLLVTLRDHVKLFSDSDQKAAEASGAR